MDAIVCSTPQWTREPGSQPIPGYRLLEPLGKGGFGEVWKCEAPGGLYKAIKFVSNLDEQNGPATQEGKALQLIKAIRHPFILSLERVEIIDDALVIVMELADKSLLGLLSDYQACEQPGIPHEELLGYLLEAAEALDWMNFGHGLQHLDVKPHNLFLVSNHVKVADFGLVDQLTDVEKTHPRQHEGGITPLYAAPELLNGTVSRHCDQYSLAIVYQQLLTGTLPFWCQNMYQLMMLHLSGEPNLSPLPPEDRPIVARALAKRAEDRFPSCMDFLQALVCGLSADKPSPPRRSALVKKISTARPPRPPSPLAAIRGEDGANERLTERGRPLSPVAHPTQRTAGNAEANTPLSSTGVTLHLSFRLPGYHLLRCTAQTPLGDTWQVEDERGNPRRALCLPGFVDREHLPIHRLQSLKHPAVPAVEAVWSSSGRWVLIGEAFGQTLRDRLEACRKQGLPGIPRAELLGYLRAAAEAIDVLYLQYGLPHLGLNPRALALRDDKVWMPDYGLVPLVWLPIGEPVGDAAGWNGRYAAPELFDRADLAGIPPGTAAREVLRSRAGSAADQFSLALIYAEMLNGIAPQMPSPRRGIGVSARHTSRSDSQQVPALGRPRLDFDLLPACDREVLRKALHDDPKQRFPSCTALVDELEAAASNTACRADLYQRLPSIIPFASLQGEPPSKHLDLPSLQEVVLRLAMPNQPPLSPQSLQGEQNTRYVLLGNDVWESKCPVQLFSGGLALKVEGFHREWQASIAEHSGNRFIFHIELPQTRTNNREKKPASLLAFQLDVQTAPASAKHLAEARMRVCPAEGDRDEIARLLPELAPRLIESMRRYLHAGREQRAEDRWQCPQPLHVYPVRPDLELEDVLDGMSRNISLGGVSLRLAKPPRTELAYLHWHKSPTISPYAVLARIVRVQAMAGGGFEIGGVF